MEKRVTGPCPPSAVIGHDTCRCGAKVEVITSAAGWPRYDCNGAVEGKACGGMFKYGIAESRKLADCLIPNRHP